jgi:hypothetical protein
MVPVFFAPDMDNAWSANPGALTMMTGFAPMQNGAYGSIGTANLFGSSTLTDDDHITAYTFRQLDGTVRFLTCRVQNIDEYDSSASRTNRGTGYNAATTGWSMAAWGNQIIACNFLDATQSSTGAGFSALSGAPKARRVAANQNFVIFADVDDGGSNIYPDMVWWSGIQNPAQWTPSIATQCGNYRLLDAPGPIREIVAYRDTFVAFKDNAVFVGEYIGPPYVWSWRLVSNRVGCIAPNGVAELDGRLYFVHTSGFYEFDGNALRNIGVPVTQSFLRESSLISGVSVGGVSPPGGSFTADGVTTTQTAVDDIEGIVWFKGGYVRVLDSDAITFLYGYNARSQKWGRHNVETGSVTGKTACMVRGSTVDAQAFKADGTGRFLMVWNTTAGTTVRSIRYPAATTDTVPTSVTTGLFGGKPSGTLTKTSWRLLAGSEADSGMTLIVTGYKDEAKLTSMGSATAAVNTEFAEGDYIMNARYRQQGYTWSVGKVTILGGLGGETNLPR